MCHSRVKAHINLLKSTSQYLLYAPSSLTLPAFGRVAARGQYSRVVTSPLSLLPDPQAQVQCLEGEKAALEDAVGRARSTLAALTAEMGGIQAEYDQTAAALQGITQLAAAAAAAGAGAAGQGQGPGAGRQSEEGEGGNGRGLAGQQRPGTGAGAGGVAGKPAGQPHAVGRSAFAGRDGG